MEFIVDSTDEYILNVNYIKKIYCLPYYDSDPKETIWILWADCIDGRFSLDKRKTKDEIRDSFWKYFNMLRNKK